MREVYINNQQVDVNQADAVDIIYESPIFSDISKIKSNGTTTYTLPKTDRNLAIFRNADQHDVKNDKAYEEWRFDEFRNGLPIIQNGRCRLLKIAEKIELAVVWGTKVPLSEKLGKKLNEIAKNSDLYRLYEDFCDVTDDYLRVEDTAQIGFLHAHYGEGFRVDNDDNNNNWRVPSVTAHKILSIIEKTCGITIDVRDKEVLKLLEKKWIPFATLKTNDDDDVDNQNKKIVKFATTLLDYNGTHFDFVLERVKDSGSSDWADLVEFRKDGGEAWKNYFTYFKIPNKDSWLDISFSVIFKGERYSKIKITLECYSSPTQKTVVNLGESKLVYNIEKGKSSVNVRILKQLKDLPLNPYTEGGQNKGYYKFDFRIYEVLNDGRENNLQFRQHVEDTLLNVYVDGKLTLANPAGLKKQLYPVVPNLPDMTCIDFIKSICQMYCLFPYFDFEKNILEFLKIDDIVEPRNVENAKNWDDKVLLGEWSIERLFGDYARRNRFRYQEDETVATISEGFMELDNQALVAEKDMITLKFSATDMKEKIYLNSGIGRFFSMAYLPFFLKKDSGEVEYKSIKPRILSEGKIRIKDDTDWIDYKSLNFDSSMKFEGDEGLIKIYYELYKNVVSKPVVRDVTVLLSEVELMNMSTLAIIYLRGKYWMPIKIQVGIDGKAKARLILLPKVFK